MKASLNKILDTIQKTITVVYVIPYVIKINHYLNPPVAAPNKQKLKRVFWSLLLHMFLTIKNGCSENQKSFLCEKNHFPFYDLVKKINIAADNAFFGNY